MRRSRGFSLAVAALLLAVLLAGCAQARLVTNDDVRRIEPQAAQTAVNSGKAIIYDVRARSAYEGQHVAGALALPENELDTLFPTLPADGDLILYCT